jgi:hypothetical protein
MARYLESLEYLPTEQVPEKPGKEKLHAIRK